jgi:benzoyl-CoA reductase subunit BamC
MCESDPPLPEPMCVQVCRVDALIYVEREAEVAEEEAKKDEVVIGLESLANTHGLNKVIDEISQIYKTMKR